MVKEKSGLGSSASLYDIAHYIPNAVKLEVDCNFSFPISGDAQRWIQNFPEGTQTLEGDAKLIFGKMFCRKLHENERSRTTTPTTPRRPFEPSLMQNNIFSTIVILNVT